MDEQFVKSSGNVFADLELPDPEVREYKADLVIALKCLIKEQAMTQAEAAQRCGTDQGTLSKVLRGRTSLVTTDRLLRWLNALGVSVRITIERTHGPSVGDAPIPGQPLSCVTVNATSL